MVKSQFIEYEEIDGVGADTFKNFIRENKKLENKNNKTFTCEKKSLKDYSFSRSYIDEHLNSFWS